MHLDNREARTAAAWLNYTIACRYRAREPVPHELLALQDRLLNEIDGTPVKDSGDRIGVRTASLILRCTDRRVRALAERLGGTRVDGRWVFDREKVEEFDRTRRLGKSHRSSETGIVSGLRET